MSGIDPPTSEVGNSETVLSKQALKSLFDVEFDGQQFVAVTHNPSICGKAVVKSDDASQNSVTDTQLHSSFVMAPDCMSTQLSIGHAGSETLSAQQADTSPPVITQVMTSSCKDRCREGTIFTEFSDLLRSATRKKTNDILSIMVETCFMLLYLYHVLVQLNVTTKTIFDR